MDLFLGVAAPAIDESLQKFVNRLVAHLTLQPMAFFPATKIGLREFIMMVILNVAFLFVIFHHFQPSPSKTSFQLWKRGLLLVLHSLMWVLNPHDIKYEKAAATAILKLAL